MLGCYNGSILSIHKGVGDEKRVASYLFNLHIGQVVGVNEDIGVEKVKHEHRLS